MTTAAKIREQTRIRAQRHRALRREHKAVYSVKAKPEQLVRALERWRMPQALSWRHDLAEVALSDAVDLLTTDPVLDARIRRLIAERPQR
jgi:hypothetical protein